MHGKSIFLGLDLLDEREMSLLHALKNKWYAFDPLENKCVYFSMKYLFSFFWKEIYVLHARIKRLCYCMHKIIASMLTLFEIKMALL